MSKELLVSTEQTGQQYAVMITDLHTGTVIKTFKDDGQSSHGLCCFAGDSVLSAVNNKPLIYSWPLGSQERGGTKLIAPGVVTALAVSNDCNYYVAAVQEKIYVWLRNSGEMLCVINEHHQDVCNLKFVDDDSYLISAGNDNLIIVWDFHEVVQRNISSSAVLKPKFTWNGHFLPVTGIFCGSGGAVSRVASVSYDCSCKLWSLQTGVCLTTFVFGHPLTAVVMDSLETHLFVGSNHGEIHRVNLYEKPVNAVKSSDSSTLCSVEKAVKCLSVSMDGRLLISGSDDCNIRIWDIESRQCTRTIPQKGPITSIVVIMTPAMYHQSQSAAVNMPLKKNLISSDDEQIMAGSERVLPSISAADLKDVFGQSDSSDGEKMLLMQDEFLKMKSVCQKMYEKAVKDIVDEI